jgi:hypothetical protein
MRASFKPILSNFLARHRTSANSVTMIADAIDGTIIAYSNQKQPVRAVNGKGEVARLNSITDGNVREAFRQYVETNQDDFLFRSPLAGEEMSASFTKVPDSFLKSWIVVNVTPTNDFVGTLEAANRQMVVIIVELTALELILMYFVSARLARPIDRARLARTEVCRELVFRRRFDAQVTHWRNRPEGDRLFNKLSPGERANIEASHGICTPICCSFGFRNRPS